MTRDLHQEITDRFIGAIEAGVAPWRCGWLRGGLPRRVTGDHYQGINTLMLGMTAMQSGYAAPTWMTFKQALELGGAVRKGEKGAPVVFFKRLEREEAGDNGETRTVGIPMLRGYTVFNAEQIAGLPDRFAATHGAALEPKDRDPVAEAALRASGADIAEDGGSRAYYDRAGDTVHLPRFELFRSTGGFLATMAHELVHWTGAEHRLARAKGSFGDPDYAFEELVAEIGAAFVCGRLGVAGDHFESHAAYVGSWLKIMAGDKRAIFRAAALAQSSANLLLASQPAQIEEIVS